MKSTLLFKAAVAALVLTACSSEDSATKAANTNSNTNSNAKLIVKNGFSKLQNTAMNNLTKTYTFDSKKESVSIQTSSGVVINVIPNQLTVNGAPVTGTVTVKFAAIFKRGDMVTANKTTLGVPEGSYNPESELWPLFTGGQVFVTMTNSQGQNVDEGSPYTLIVPVSATESPAGADDMVLWQADENDEGEVNWEEDTNDETGESTEVPKEGDKYIVEMLSFGWCNIDKLDQIPGERTKMFVDVPDGYDNNNAAVYLSYQGFINLLVELDSFDTSTGYFGNSHNNTPVGMQCNIIFVSEQGGQWLYAVKPVTITPNGLVTINASDIATASTPALIALLNSLP
jgi:hypothetical protein